MAANLSVPYENFPLYGIIQTWGGGGILDSPTIHYVTVYYRINYIINFGILNIQERYSYTALHHAAMEGHIDILDLLLNKGSDVNLIAGVCFKPYIVLYFRISTRKHGLNEALGRMFISSWIFQHSTLHK